MLARLFRTIRRRLWRDRRRYGVCAVLLFAAGYISFLDQGGALFGIPIGVLAGLAFVLGILPLGVLLCLMIPGWRFTCEVATFGLFLLAVVGQIWWMFSLLAVPYAGNAVLFAQLCLLTIIGQLYCTDLLDRWTRKGHPIRYRLRSRLPAEVLWDGLVGTPPHIERLANENVTRFEYLTPGRPDRLMVERYQGMALVEEHQIVEAISAPNHMRFRWTAVDAEPDLPFGTGTKDLRITDNGSYRTVQVTQRARAHPWRAVVLNWIDDSFGRHYDKALAVLERRDASGPDGPQGAMAPA